ncbi:alpha-L-rhamnosidase [Tunicatimonas pelagia]|uniref:alpha-L-rhamnosidase n=1 Tax=Tunicatimonas pelagia TaxID=931531 RepID=UPI002665ADE9|nr:alpha-L-rhamnosidase [Tunicatimonas pelagia]WKN40754.1 family 78 glycoside hydrolase catalytic domain [Tunicatimonas pelagia]
MLPINRSFWAFPLLFFPIWLYCSSTRAQTLAVEDLRCEYLANPLGIDLKEPRLAWKLQSSVPDTRQTAYRILVASSPETLAKNQGNLWDSNRVPSEESRHITYAGSPLSSRQRCYWKVKVWDNHGNESAWSTPAYWEMALLDSTDWQARWIRHPDFMDTLHESKPAPYFRKTFRIENLPTKARAYVTGLGYFELYINGQKVGDHLLDPVKTRYDKSVRYLTHDITNLLRAGENTVGMVLGTGWYNHFADAVWGFNQAPWRSYPEALCQLEITDDSGSIQRIASDESWKTTTQGPVRFDGIRNGETYDAQLEMFGWSDPWLDDSSWENVVIGSGPKGQLRAQMIPPIKAQQEIRPVSVEEVQPGVWVFDLGQNIAGFSRLKVAGPKGTEVSMKMGEKRFSDGTVEQKQILRFLKSGDAQTDRYILKGEGVEVWGPRFVYHGFQYVEVRGLPTPPTNETITGVVLYTDFDQTGSFTCSDPQLNQTQQNMHWAFVGNYHGLPTDCPHREKIGWTGDAQLVAETGLFNYDMVRSYLKWLDDFVDEQQENGDLPGVIPSSGWGYEHGKDPELRSLGYGPQWEGALVQITWDLYRFTGDPTILERYYPTIKKYLDHLIRNADNYTLNFGIDDHKPVETKTEGDILASGYLVGFTQIFSQMANVLNQPEDEQYYQQYSEKAKKAFNKHYFNAKTGSYGNSGQTSLALALYHKIVPEEKEELVLDNLLANIQQRNYHFDVGVVGLKYLFNVLREYGHSEALHRMVTQTDIPGFGYWLAQGANTLWQDWDGSMSLNHIMFGTVSEWFYESLAGIQIDEEQPGFRHFIIRPDMLPQLDWANGSVESPFGMISSSWEKAGEMTTMRVTVPPNAKATVYVPYQEGQTVKLNGEESAEGKTEEGRRIFEVASGNYVWEVE